jgi:hypothetical protein
MAKPFLLLLAVLAFFGLFALVPTEAAINSQSLPETSMVRDGTEQATVLDRLAATFELQFNNNKLKLKVRGCPNGQNRDPNTGECFSCSHNNHLENGECVPNVKKKKKKVNACPQGTEFKDGQCQPIFKKKKKINTCPEGTELRDGQCQKSEFPEIEQCPDGQNLDPNTGVCFSCSHNDHFENGKCVPCKEGFHVEGDECVAD